MDMRDKGMNIRTANIKICESPDQAPNYNKIGGYKAASIEEFLIVRKGTSGNRSTVDVIFTDESGQKYMTMLSGRIVRSLAQVIGDEG